MKSDIDRAKVIKKTPRQPLERRTLIAGSNSKSSIEDDITTQTVTAVMEVSSDDPSPDQSPATDEGVVWQQRYVWSLDPGTNIIRILPPYDKKGYVYEKIPHHWRVGPEERGVICRRYIGAHCFICEMITRLLGSESAADRDLAQRMARNLRYFFNVIDVKDPTRGVLVWGTSEAMTAQLLPWFNPQFPDATDPQHGRNISIIKSGEGRNSRYSEAKLAPKPSAISYARWMRDIKHLDQYLRIPSVQIQRRMFEGT
jgi:gp32 DNA binding protein like